jgi:hypothetical protein
MIRSQAKSPKNGTAQADSTAVTELEEDLHRVRSDFESFKNENAKQLRSMELNIGEVTKTDLEDLERRQDAKQSELLNTLTNNFTEKEATKRKFANIEKNVSAIKGNRISSRVFTISLWTSSNTTQVKMTLCSRASMWARCNARRVRRTS